MSNEKYVYFLLIILIGILSISFASANENICVMFSDTKKDKKKYIVFVTYCCYILIDLSQYIIIV